MGFGSIVGSAIGAAGSLVGGLISNNSQNQLAQQNYQAQKEFAQNGIRWKVADAKAAGLHPLAALGAQGYTYNPVAVGGSDLGFSDAAGYLSQMGQGIDRARLAKEQAAERALERKAQEAKMAEESQLRAAEIRRLDSETALNQANSKLALMRASLPPAMPSMSRRDALASQGDVLPSNGNKWLDKPIKQYGWSFDENGNRQLVPSSDYAQLVEDKAIIEWLPFMETAGKALKSMLFNSKIDGRRYYFGRGWLTDKEWRDRANSAWKKSPLYRNK